MGRRSQPTQPPADQLVGGASFLLSLILVLGLEPEALDP
jgi:hypothetical protein